MIQRWLIGLIIGIAIAQDHPSGQMDPDYIIRQMEQADRQLMTTGYTLVLKCERPNGFYPDMKVHYRVRATCNDKITAIVDDQMRYTGAPNYKHLKENVDRWSPIKYSEGSPLPLGRAVEMLYYEDASRKLYVQGQAAEVVQVYPDGKIVVGSPCASTDDRIGITIERSRNMGVSATWFDYSVLALGRKVSAMLGKGIAAQPMKDGRVQLVAKHRNWSDGEWHLVVDPQRAYLVVEAKLIDKSTNEIVKQWWSTGSIGDKLPFARRAVLRFKPKDQDYLVVECVEYRLCFDDDFARQVLQRIKRQRSFRDMRVEPFLDIRVR
ncbi:MAG: hypothetical protein QXI60_07745 [Thermofilaceae archaeon]